MNITLTGLNALKVLRMVRRKEVPGASLSRRTNLQLPSPAPKKRWSASAIDLSALGILFDERHPLGIAVPAANKRVRMRSVSNTVYASGLPENSFVDVGNGVFISCPELLFVELTNVMDAPAHVLLGLELCGSFARDPNDPRNGTVAFDLAPVTSAEKIRSYIERCKNVRDLSYAAERAKYVLDNAWSPMEAILATLLRLPIGEYGYDLGELELNRRVEAPEQLRPYVEKTTRVPDILLKGTTVGVNYDGEVHFDLEEIARRAASGEDVAAAIDDARRKVVDDRRRDRDLLAQGYLVLPATSEDLYQEGDLDKLAGQLIELAERTAGRDYSLQRKVLELKMATGPRQRVIWSLLPGERGRRLARELSEEARREFELVAEELVYL